MTLPPGFFAFASLLAIAGAGAALARLHLWMLHRAVRLQLHSAGFARAALLHLARFAGLLGVAALVARTADAATVGAFLVGFEASRRWALSARELT